MTSRSTQKRTSVLLVEDDADSRQSLGMLLRMWGHSVALAETGSQALELAEAQAPRIVLLDVNLPDVDGYELAGRLRSLRTFPEHLIALTGYDSDDDRERSRNAGFRHHLVKPVNLDRLRELLSDLSD